MIIPVRCMTCNKVIGSIYEEYLKKIKEKSQLDSNVNLGIILDSIGIKRYCCRRMILSNVDMFESLMNYQ